MKFLSVSSINTFIVFTTLLLLDELQEKAHFLNL